MDARRRRAALPAFLALAFALSGCGMSHAGDTPRAVVIGIDGADWRIVDPLIEAGRMPNLAALRERGSSGPIRTLVDYPLSPVVWTSVVTGKTPAKHGITWFLVDRKDGSRVPVRSHNRRAKALWNVLAERGLRAVSIGWWASYPAEDVGPGVMVSDGLGFHGFGRTAREGDDARKVWPSERFGEFDALVPPEQSVSYDFTKRFLHLSEEQFRNARFDPARTARADPDNPLHLFQQYAVTAQGYTSIAEKLLGEPYDLFLVYFEQVDSFSHLFMKHAAPRLEWISEEDHALFEDAVTEWYAYQDELLGRLLAKIDLDTTAVFVLSDHGFKSGERRIHSEHTVDINAAHLDHEPEGILLAAGPGIRRGAKIEEASVLDLAPTVLQYLGLPVGKDMDGKSLAGVFEPELLGARPLAYVSTYEGEPKAKPTGEDVAELGADELAENEERLATLGYVEKSGGEADAGADDESSPEIHDNLARIHARAGELDQAVAEFEKALALAPNDADALLGLSAIAAQRGNGARAEQLAKIALASNPDFPPALAQLADLRREAGDPRECARLYEQAVALHDAMPGLYLGLGDCQQRAGEFAKAEAAFTRASELDPDSIAAVYNLGVTAFQQGREEDAIALYERALAIDPKSALAAAILNNLGTVHLDRGEKEKAIARWKEAVAASPAQLESRYNLAAQYLEQGKLDDALPLLEEAARLAPNHELVHTRLANVYLQKGRGQDAYRVLTLVHRLYPENWFAPLGLAVLHAANERESEARALLDEALRLGGDDAKRAAKGYAALAPLLGGGAEAGAH
ncbi:MAG: tetratricopeptide repeat protein [Myxococcota bacterium]